MKIHDMPKKGYLFKKGKKNIMFGIRGDKHPSWKGQEARRLNELKTLKDIDPEACCGGLRIKELKAEAIKHTKVLKVKSISKDSDLANMGAYLWIKHFFNIKEEDLK